jgi:integrase
MIYKQRGSKYYWTKFMWRGEIYRKSTGATDKKTARTIEAKIRSELAQANFGIFQPKETTLLADFLTDRFLPFVESTPDIKSNTREYYRRGTAHLLASKKLAGLELTEIDEQQVAKFAARNPHSISTLNRNLRTLRHALKLAEKWKVIDRAQAVRLSPGENERDRVVTDEEMTRYLTASLQPWRDIASIMFMLGMRPGEVYALRWEQIDFQNGFLFIIRGKTEKAKRQLSLEPVQQILEYRHQKAGLPTEGWVFPANTKSGHIQQGSAKNQHLKALARSGVKPFAPYSLRHTALTNLAGVCDTFALKSIAGHASIRTTQRYVHPQAVVISEAFTKIAERKKIVIAGGHSDILAPETQTA